MSAPSPTGVTISFAVALVLQPHCVAADEQRTVRRSRLTGLATSVTVVPARAGTEPPRLRPLGFLHHHGHHFGITDPDRQLAVRSETADRLHHRHTTWVQVHRGIPVLSAMLKVHQDPGGRVVSANGDCYAIPDQLDTEPHLSPAEAADAAEPWVLVPDPQLESRDLVIVDPGWYGDPPRGPRLAYHVIASSASAGSRESMLVDAHTGELLDRWSLVLGDRYRLVHDGEGGMALPGRLARGEGQTPAGPEGDPAAEDVNLAYDYAGDTWELLTHAFARDSLDGAGMPLVSTVNSTSVEAFGSCPGAYWNGTQAVFCLGRVPDDVVAHELTHGLTLLTAGLIPQNQSGALNESFSFVFGEVVDLFNGGAENAGESRGPPQWSAHSSGPGLDQPNLRRSSCSPAPGYPDGVRWLYNEDRLADEGATFDLWDPTCLGHPDRADSTLFQCPVWDQGGTHIGAGVPNHAFAMLTDGKSFNGFEVEGIGLIKSAAVWYRALTTYLTPAADFEESYWCFLRAAEDLIGTFPTDPRTGQPSTSTFTARDAEQVERALRAVEMHTPGRCGGTVDLLQPGLPAECANRRLAFSESFEHGLGEWTVANSGPPTPYDWETTAPGQELPLQRTGRAAHCADPPRPCAGSDESAVHSLVSPLIELPDQLSFPTLAFTHAVIATDWWDGGTLAINVDGERWHAIPATAFYHNGYNRTLYSALHGNTNPLAGEPAFSGAGLDWYTSLVHLGGFVSGGETIQIRFDFGKNCWSFGALGWFVDDVRVYDCGSSLDCNTNGLPDEVETADGSAVGRPEVVLLNPPDHSSALLSDASSSPYGVMVRAQRLSVLVPRSMHTVRIWGGVTSTDTPPPDSFTLLLHDSSPSTGLPGAVVAMRWPEVVGHELTGHTVQGYAEWELTLHLEEPLTVGPGEHWLELFADSRGHDHTFFWVTSGYTATAQNSAVASEAPGQVWQLGDRFDQAIQILGELVGADCNRNRVPDSCDIAAGVSWDTDGDGVPDECRPDGDGVPDECRPRRPSGRVGSSTPPSVGRAFRSEPREPLSDPRRPALGQAPPPRLEEEPRHSGEDQDRYAEDRRAQGLGKAHADRPGVDAEPWSVTQDHLGYLVQPHPLPEHAEHGRHHTPEEHRVDAAAIALSDLAPQQAESAHQRHRQHHRRQHHHRPQHRAAGHDQTQHHAPLSSSSREASASSTRATRDDSANHATAMTTAATRLKAIIGAMRAMQ